MNKFVEGAQSIVKIVATPLRFFAAVIIALTMLIAMLAWKSALPSEMTVYLIELIFVIVVLLIVLVAVLIIFYPKKLVFDQEAHLIVMREQLGDNEFLPARALPSVKVLSKKNGI